MARFTRIHVITRFWIILSFSQINNVLSVDLKSYLKMPPILELDEYDRCLYASSRPSTYCIAHSQIQSNISSPSWTEIQVYGDPQRRYRHDHIKRGICVETCERKLEKYNKIEREKLYLKRLEYKPGSQMYLNVFTGGNEDDLEYNKLISECINLELLENYGLMAESRIEYCVRNNNNHKKSDFLDTAFLAVFITLCVMLVLSTSYDFYLKLHYPHHLKESADYYKIPIKDKSTSILVSFSLYRNWYRLTMASTKPYQDDLQSLNGVKFLMMCAVVLSHSSLLLSYMGTLNPQYMEENFYVVPNMVLINGSHLTPFYLLMSGFLLTVYFDDIRPGKKGFTIRYYLRVVFLRYIRLTPAYAFMILLHSSVLQYFQDGPLWRYIVEPEREFCRANWWTNLLYINNYVKSNEPCVQQSWYHAVDFQLFIAGSLIMFFLDKYPSWSKFVFGVGISFSLIQPALITYFKNLFPIYLITLESNRFAQWYDQVYHDIYIPGHSNIICYLCGMISGLTYLKWKENKFDLRDIKGMHLIWYISQLGVLALLMSCYIFYIVEFERPSIGTSIFASFYRNVWGPHGSFFILGLCFNFGWILRDVWSHPISNILGKLTFGAYLNHVTVTRTVYGSIRSPVYLNHLTMVTYFVAILFLSYLLSAFMALLIEFPVSALQSITMQKGNATKSDSSKGNNKKST